MKIRDEIKFILNGRDITVNAVKTEQTLSE